MVGIFGLKTFFLLLLFFASGGGYLDAYNHPIPNDSPAGTLFFFQQERWVPIKAIWWWEDSDRFGLFTPKHIRFSFGDTRTAAPVHMFKFED